MKLTVHFPKIKAVKAQPGYRLLAQFENGDSKLYDCTPLLDQKTFAPLKDPALFRCAHADPHGYGVVWNDDIDLAESEIWINGEDAEPKGEH